MGKSKRISLRCKACGKINVLLLFNGQDTCEACQRRKSIADKKEQQRQAVIAELSNRIKSIPRAEVKISNSSSTKRNHLSDMGEIKISNVTRRFNKDTFSNFVVIDVETTGIKVVGNSILEVSAIRYIDFTPEEYFSTRISPEKPIPSEATAVNGITDEMVVDSPKFFQIKDSLSEFIGNSPLIGHNVAFDLKHLYYHGLDLLGKRKIYDTLQIAKKILKRHSEYDEERAIDRDTEYDYDVYDYKLDTLCEYYGIATANLHQSVYDCMATAELFENMVDDILDR